jgi:hypothetical protein
LGAADGAGRVTIPPSRLPLQISPDRRYLADQDGRPFLIHGDTPWSLISALTREEADLYLSNRRDKGFNAIIANLVEHKFNGPRNRYGEQPFHRPEDLSTPNEKYFQHADWVLQRAAEYGFIVFLAPLYLGLNNNSNDEGWFHEVRASGPAKCFQFGQYIGERYTSFNNLVWLMGGDRNPAGVIDEEFSLVQGIKQFDQHSLFTASPELEQSTLETYGGRGWLDFNSTYSYQIVHKNLLADYNRRPVMPNVLLSTTYENEHNASSLQIRRQAYWAILCGACGQFLGNYPIWLLNPGWQDALESPGSLERVHLKSLFAALPWHELIPDQKHAVVTGGLGEFNGMDYLADSLTGDRRILVAYLPTARRVTVDLAGLSGKRLVGVWFNPRTGETTSVGEFDADGERCFDPPGEGDWVLIIHDSGLDLPVPNLNPEVNY